MRRHKRVITVIVILTFAAFAASFIATSAPGIRRLTHGARSIDFTIVGLGLVCSGVAMVNRGMLNRAAHRVVGLDATVATMTRTAAVGFAAQKMVKSAGAVGLAVFIRNGRKNGYEPGSVGAACVLAAAASFVALGVLLVAAIGVLVVTDRLTGWWIAAAVGFGIYTALVGVVVAVIVRSRRAATRVWQWAQQARRHLPGGRSSAPCAAFPIEMFDAFATARRRPGAIRQLLLHAVASKLLGAVMLASAVTAAGLPVGPPAALVIYATALAASMVTIVPGGFGVVEGSTAALLVAAGASGGAAALAVALFRLFDLWLPVLAGAAFARGALGAQEPAPSAGSLRRPAAIVIAPTAA
jgi:uncharacterized membrane protein YbhN (UPF0104 family)